MPRFSETLREHASHPSNRGKLAGANAIGQASVSNNPPYVTMHLRIEGEQIVGASFESEGCGVTTAACSSITEMIENRSITDCQAISPEAVAESLEGIPADKMHCAQVVVKALNNAISNYSESNA